VVTGGRGEEGGENLRGQDGVGEVLGWEAADLSLPQARHTLLPRRHRLRRRRRGVPPPWLDPPAFAQRLKNGHTAVAMDRSRPSLEESTVQLPRAFRRQTGPKAQQPQPNKYSKLIREGCQTLGAGKTTRTIAAVPASHHGGDPFFLHLAAVLLSVSSTFLQQCFALISVLTPRFPSFSRSLQDDSPRRR
jgi:hypothetical protein